MAQQTHNQDTPSTKDSLDIDVAELREKLGPKKVALIDQWIREVNGPLDALIAQHVTPETLKDSKQKILGAVLTERIQTIPQAV